MRYDIRVTITYEYPAAASAGRHLLRLMPRSLPGQQRVLSGLLDVNPTPVSHRAGSDFFGNATTDVALAAAHSESTFTLSARVERFRDGKLLDVSPRLSELPRAIENHAGLDPQAPHHFLGASPRIALHPDMAAYARDTAHPGATVADIVRTLGDRLHADFTFNPTATTVDTSPIEAFARREGVCQDYAQVMITCLRSLGIPAGYVSGVLRTIPPENQPRLEGADAMHAWVRAWCGPQMGWLQYDPTNATEVFNDHIVIAYGRDYSDVAPIKGYMRSVGSHSTRQAVDVIPLRAGD